MDTLPAPTFPECCIPGGQLAPVNHVWSTGGHDLGDWRTAFEGLAARQLSHLERPKEPA